MQEVIGSTPIFSTLFAKSAEFRMKSADFLFHVQSLIVMLPLCTCKFRNYRIILYQKFKYC